MPKITFYPLGNADSILIDLKNGEKVLFDFADTSNSEDEADCRINLSEELRSNFESAGRDYVDVFAVTHLDLDHVKKSSEFFWLDHAAKYQGEGRFKIKEFWVPAAVICEDRPDQDDAWILQNEARHRFKQGYGIRVFSEPEALRCWCENNGISLDSRRSLITNAGEIAPRFNKNEHGVEFFVHCPFAHRTERGEKLNRNDDSLVMQATFVESGVETKFILGSDVTWEMWVEIVNLSRKYGNEARLAWDIFKLPHHCSYLSLGPNKGTQETEPDPKVAWLYEVQGQEFGIVVSTSDPIPAVDTSMPPHFQAASYHKRTASSRMGDFLVTMEYPNKIDPKPLTIRIDNRKATVEKSRSSGIASILSMPAPRAG